MTIRPIPVVRNVAASGINRGRRALLCVGSGNVKAVAMEQMPKPLSREERLAAQLRENLKRRKAQARALAGDSRAAAGDSPPHAEADEPQLPQLPPKNV
jgi:hypothetical protein